jgi:pimeloyl-ACP methyl ester carboxylesterase
MSSNPRIRIVATALLLSLASAAGVAPAVAAPDGASAAVAESSVRYRTVEIDGVDVFYREAGPVDAPVVVLLHGFPTSSHMFRNLIPALAGRYRVIAPDYPGFGHSEVPDRAKFQYTFAHVAAIVDALLSRLNAKRYALYVMDYGAPVGYRLALAHPERVSALIVQNGNAYEDGLKEFWNPLRAFWSSGSLADREKVREALTLESIRWQYTDGVKDVSRIDPTTWVLDHALVSRPGNADVQLDLIYDYRTNVELYPRFHAFFREHRPPTLIVWGRNDQIFHADGARAYLRDLPDAELHLLDTGHFALEDSGPEISRLIVDFLDRKLPRG